MRAQAISFPDESGRVLTTNSSFSTLNHVGNVRTGSLVAPFGPASVAALTSRGDAVLHAHTTLGDSARDRLKVLAHMTTPYLFFDQDSNGRGLNVRPPPQHPPSDLDYASFQVLARVKGQDFTMIGNGLIWKTC